MDFNKYQAGDLVKVLRHDYRRFPDGKSTSNEAIVSSLTKENYSLIDRGKTVQEVVDYFHDLEKEIFMYNRADYVHAVEWIVTMPDDCPPEQERKFFEVAKNYFVSTLPMGEKCLICCEVHKDEKYVNPATGEVVSKPAHMHLMYVPAVKLTVSEKRKIKEQRTNQQLKAYVKKNITGPRLKVQLKKAGLSKEAAEEKIDELKEAARKEIAEEIPDYEYKLCADALTKISDLLKVHPGLQKTLDDTGIKATVWHGNTGANYIHLSGKQLKEITKLCGKTITHSMTVEELSELISSNIKLEKQVSVLRDDLKLKDAQIEKIQGLLSRQKTAEKTVPAVSSREQVLQKKYDELKSSYDKKSAELEKANEKIKALEKTNEELLEKSEEIEKTKDKEWGEDTWGSDDWGQKSNTKDILW